MKWYLLLLAIAATLCSHDMYLKMDSYCIEPNSSATVLLYNGTFDRSDNTIDRNRMIDVSLVGSGVRTSIDTALCTEDGNAAILRFTIGEPGTWMAGVSTHPRNIEMEAVVFNDYLEPDGVLDMLEWRTENDALS